MIFSRCLLLSKSGSTRYSKLNAGNLRFWRRFVKKNARSLRCALRSEKLCQTGFSSHSVAAWAASTHAIPVTQAHARLLILLRFRLWKLSLMPVLRVVVLWHQHQPYYKDLVTGEYRLPWVRLHALKDYYGMVKVLDEFPNVHQTFNLVPSLITQIQDYVSGAARDPFFEVAAKPAKDLTSARASFCAAVSVPGQPGKHDRPLSAIPGTVGPISQCGGLAGEGGQIFPPQDFTDLQVLSQIAWFDEFFLDDPDIAGLIRKGTRLLAGRSSAS